MVVAAAWVEELEHWTCKLRSNKAQRNRAVRGGEVLSSEHSMKSNLSITDRRGSVIHVRIENSMICYCSQQSLYNHNDLKNPFH